MKTCSLGGRINDYLLDRMSGPDRTLFEEHFFNCDRCFQEVSQRDALLRAIRAHGSKIFPPEALPAVPRAGSRVGFLRLWPYFAAGAALLLAAWIGFNPRVRDGGPLPLTAPADDAVRGGSVELIAPEGLLVQAPSALEWKTPGPGTDCTVSLSGPGLAWSGRTSAGRIELPEEIRGKMIRGAEYRWKVRAFAPQGGLTGASQEGVFRIAD